MKVILTPRFQGFSKEQQKDLEKDLDSLADFSTKTKNLPYLVGGVAIALHVGEFYRNHRDFDLALFEQDLKGFYDLSTQAGYEFYHSHFATHISKEKHMIIGSKTNPKKIKKRARGCFAVVPKERGLVQEVDRGNYFHVYLLREQFGGIYLVKNNLQIDKSDFFPVVNHERETGVIRLPNMKYKSLLSANRPRQQEDMERFNKTLE